MMMVQMCWQLFYLFRYGLAWPDWLWNSVELVSKDEFVQAEGFIKNVLVALIYVSLPSCMHPPLYKDGNHVLL